MQNISHPLSFHTVRDLIKRSFKVRAKEDHVSHKSWKNAVPNLCNGPRLRAVAEFRLATGHDCLQYHLHRFKIVPSPICPLRSSREVMDAAHLPHCPALRKTFLAERYWEARDMLD
ncbi:uncharacterized protein LOC118189855 [Stegodyphus dumicola]|uniref:uncharacterized protein LOC118189855 n=1 Tax=Stegodyphus dumicola TaxID=202533 RepID=UPI0015A82494|nr:uncharacterized protein LOC118189855 [Stegodyphus dumicola]